MKKFVVIIVIAVLLLATVLVVFLVVLPSMNSGVAVATVEPTFSYSPGEYFTSNLAQNGKTGTGHLLRVTILFEVSDEKYVEALVAKNDIMQPKIRDAVIFALRRFTIDDINVGEADNQSALRAAVLTAVNEAMRDQDIIKLKAGQIQTDHFKSVIITDIVVQ
jgi:flagellar basal body-associated protein FliL